MLKRLGVSTYISVLLLLVVTIAGGIVIYGYVNGFFGEAISPETPAYLSTDSITCNQEVMIIYLRNIGKTPANINRIYIEGTPILEDKANCIIKNLNQDNEIKNGETIEITIYNDYQLQNIYNVKIITDKGLSLSKQVKCSSNQVRTRYTRQINYWSLDKDTALAGNPVNESYEGTITGAEHTTGVSFGALNFDGIYDNVYVQEGENLDLTNSGTLEAWVYIQSHEPFAGIIHKGEKGDFSDESYSLQFWDQSGLVRLAIFQGSSYFKLDSNTLISTDTWHHIIGTWNQTHLGIYIDGKVDNWKANTFGAATPTDGGLVIGAQLMEDYNIQYKRFGLNGIIDEVSIYNKSLTHDEIKQRYQDLNPN